MSAIPHIWTPNRDLLTDLCPHCGKPRRHDRLGKARRFRDWLRAPVHAMGRAFSANGWVFGASGGCLEAASGSGCGCTKVQQLYLCGYGLSSVYIPTTSLPTPFSSNFYLQRASDGLCYYAVPGDPQVAYTTQTLVGTFTNKTACGCEKCPTKVTLSFTGINLATTCTPMIGPFTSGAACGQSGYSASPVGTPSFGTYSNLTLGAARGCGSFGICGLDFATSNQYFDSSNTSCSPAYSGGPANAHIYISYFEDASLGPMWGVSVSATPLSTATLGDAWIFWGCAPSAGNNAAVTISNSITAPNGTAYSTAAINNLEGACCPPTFDTSCRGGFANIVMGNGGSVVLTPTP